PCASAGRLDKPVAEARRLAEFDAAGVAGEPPRPSDCPVTGLKATLERAVVIEPANWGRNGVTRKMAAIASINETRQVLYMTFVLLLRFHVSPLWNSGAPTPIHHCFGRVPSKENGRAPGQFTPKASKIFLGAAPETI